MKTLNIQHGDRVLVYDSIEFVNDLVTPFDMLMRPATVICRYGAITNYGSGPVKYPDLIDVVFDHRPDKISRGHFTEGCKIITGIIL